MGTYGAEIGSCQRGVMRQKSVRWNKYEVVAHRLRGRGGQSKQYRRVVPRILSLSLYDFALFNQNL